MYGLFNIGSLYILLPICSQLPQTSLLQSGCFLSYFWTGYIRIFIPLHLYKHTERNHSLVLTGIPVQSIIICFFIPRNQPLKLHLPGIFQATFPTGMIIVHPKDGGKSFLFLFTYFYPISGNTKTKSIDPTDSQSVIYNSHHCN